MRWWRLIWPLPWTMFGLGLGLLAVCLGAGARRQGRTLEVCGGALATGLRRLGRHCPFEAITFGHVILALDEDIASQLRAHERIHVGQYERWGPLFVPLYLGSSLLQWCRGRDPYRCNRFEREAFEQS